MNITGIVILCQHMNKCQLIITLAQIHVFPLELYTEILYLYRNKRLFYKLFALFCCLCTMLYAALILSKFRDHILHEAWHLRHLLSTHLYCEYE